MRLILVLSVILLSSNLTATGQVKTITGKVIDEFFDALPYVYIKNSDTITLTTTDTNGQFTISIPLETKSLSIFDIGCEPTTISLKDSCTQIDLILMRFSSYDYISIEEVNRLRRKRFKKLPKLHLMAYQKGIFTTRDACYTQSFIPFN